jgi:hypothetical protein
MPFTPRSSMATQPWLLARSVVSLWVKSCRRRACRARSLAISAMVRRGRLEYRPPLWHLAHRTCRALRRSRPSRRRCSPGVSDGRIRRGSDSSDTNAEHATPKSTPQPGSPFGGAALTPVATPKETCQPRPSWLTVALRTTPASGRDSRKRSMPTLGRRTSARHRDSLRTATAWPGNGIDTPAPRFRNRGGPAECSGFHQLSYARSSWRRICWADCAGKLASHGSSARACVRSRHWLNARIVAPRCRQANCRCSSAMFHTARQM